MAATSSFTLVSGSSASGGATSPGEQKGWLVPWYEYHGTHAHGTLTGTSRNLHTRAARASGADKS